MARRYLEGFSYPGGVLVDYVVNQNGINFRYRLKALGNTTVLNSSDPSFWNEWEVVSPRSYRGTAAFLTTFTFLPGDEMYITDLNVKVKNESNKALSYAQMATLYTRVPSVWNYVNDGNGVEVTKRRTVIEMPVYNFSKSSQSIFANSIPFPTGSIGFQFVNFKKGCQALVNIPYGDCTSSFDTYHNNEISFILSTYYPLLAENITVLSGAPVGIFNNGISVSVRLQPVTNSFVQILFYMREDSVLKAVYGLTGQKLSWKW